MSTENLGTETPEKEMMYVVGRPWYPDQPEGPLCIYMYGSEIQKGTLKNAKDFLAYVQRRSLDEPGYYAIYEVTLTKL